MGTFNSVYKGHAITVWTTKITAKAWDWQVKAGDLPMRKNSDETAPTEEIARQEAEDLAKHLLDQVGPATS